MRSGLIFRLSAVLLGVCLGLVLGELGLRIVWQPRPLPWFLSRYFVPDDDVMFVPAHLAGAEPFDIDPALPTVVALGDSFTAGYPVKRSDSYPAQLREILADHGIEANVVNLGIGASGTGTQLRYFELSVARLAPDMVIWQLYSNDVWNGCDQPLYAIEGDELVRLDATRNWRYRRRWFYDAVPLPRSVKDRSYLVRSVLQSLPVFWNAEVPKAYDTRPEDWALEKISLSLQRMDRLAQRHGFLVHNVLVAPEATWLAAGSDSSTDHWADGQYRRLRTILESRGDFIDAEPGLLAPAACGPELFVGSERDFARPGDHHLSELGYRRLAELVAKHVVAELQARHSSRTQP